MKTKILYASAMVFSGISLAHAERSCKDSANGILEPGVAKLVELNRIDNGRIWWQTKMGQKVNAQEVAKRNTIVKLDHQLEQNDIKAAADIVVDMEGKAPMGKTRTIRTIYRDVESSAVLIRNHKLKIDKLKTLMQNPELAAKLGATLDRENQALDFQRQVFGTSYYYYMTLRYHVEDDVMIVTECQRGLCRKTAEQLRTQYLGLNDSNLRSTNWLDISNFEADLKAAGVDVKSELDAAFMKNFDIEQLKANYATDLSRDKIAEIATDPDIRAIILKKEKWDQIELAVKLQLSKPVFLNLIDRVLANLPAILSTFVRVDGTEDLRKQLLEEAKKSPERFKAILGALSDERAKKVRETLGEISPYYTKAPFQHFVDVAALVGALYVTYEGGVHVPQFF